MSALPGGIALLSLLHAKGTLAMDLNGKSDPYCKVFLGEVEWAKTKTIDCTLDPVWNEDKVLVLNPGTSLDTVIGIEVWDKDLASADDFMGYHSFTVGEALHSVGEKSVPLVQNPSKKDKKDKKAGKRGVLTYNVHVFTVEVIKTMLSDNHYALVKGLIRSVINDAVASSIVSIFATNPEELVTIMNEAFKYEVCEKTANSEQLFRTDSLATKLMKATSTLVCLNWVKNTIGGLISDICAKNIDIEIDPNADPNADVAANMQALTTSCDAFLNAILKALPSAPGVIQRIVAALSQQVHSKFPEFSTQAVGGYIFLRLFCPAISTPETYGVVVEAPPAHARRHMLLVAKVLQAMANNTKLGAKQDFMLALDNFVVDKYPMLEAELVKFVNTPTGMPSETASFSETAIVLSGFAQYFSIPVNVNAVVQKATDLDPNVISKLEAWSIENAPVLSKASAYLSPSKPTPHTGGHLKKAISKKH